MALPTTSSPDDLYESGLDVDAVSLPFILSDPAAEGLQRSVRNLDASESASSFSAKEAIKLAAVNYVRVEAWKSLRIHQLKWKSPPGALSLLPSMQLDIVLEVRRLFSRLLRFPLLNFFPDLRVSAPTRAP
jgi:hypothetical protein